MPARLVRNVSLCESELVARVPSGIPKNRGGPRLGQVSIAHQVIDALPDGGLVPANQAAEALLAQLADEGHEFLVGEARDIGRASREFAWAVHTGSIWGRALRGFKLDRWPAGAQRAPSTTD